MTAWTTPAMASSNQELRTASLKAETYTQQILQTHSREPRTTVCPKSPSSGTGLPSYLPPPAAAPMVGEEMTATAAEGGKAMKGTGIPKAPRYATDAAAHISSMIALTLTMTLMRQTMPWLSQPLFICGSHHAYDGGRPTSTRHSHTTPPTWYGALLHQVLHNRHRAAQSQRRPKPTSRRTGGTSITSCLPQTPLMPTTSTSPPK